jgi:hypothetical protein
MKKKFDLQLIKDLSQLHCNYRNNLMTEKDFGYSDLEDMELFNRYFHLGITNREDLIKEIKKFYFCRLCALHPRTRHIKMSFIQNFWETVENNAN